MVPSCITVTNFETCQEKIVGQKIERKTVTIRGHCPAATVPSGTRSAASSHPSSKSKAWALLCSRRQAFNHDVCHFFGRHFILPVTTLSSPLELCPPCRHFVLPIASFSSLLELFGGCPEIFIQKKIIWWIKTLCSRHFDDTVTTPATLSSHQHFVHPVAILLSLSPLCPSHHHFVLPIATFATSFFHPAEVFYHPI
jgi:hypothetical protein